MGRRLKKQLDSETECACDTLLRTSYQLLKTDSLLRRLVGVSTTEELYFLITNEYFVDHKPAKLIEGVVEGEKWGSPGAD